MKKFKVGDRVKVFRDTSEDGYAITEPGYVGLVTGLKASGTDDRDIKVDGMFVCSKDLEKVVMRGRPRKAVTTIQFQAGDKVRPLRCHNVAQTHRGLVCTLLSAEPDSGGDYHLKLPDGGECYPSSIELVEHREEHKPTKTTASETKRVFFLVEDSDGVATFQCEGEMFAIIKLLAKAVAKRPNMIPVLRAAVHGAEAIIAA